MKPLILARPEPGNRASAHAAEARGLTVIASPLFTIDNLEWNIDNSITYDGLFVTSANAILNAGQGLAALRHLPVFAVGPASAAAARAAGFTQIITGNSNGAALAQLAVAQGSRHLLHLAGDPFKPIHHADLRLDVVKVYETRELTPSQALLDALAAPAVLLAHSPRMARRLAELSRTPAEIDLVTISEATAAAAGTGWKSITWPETPDTTAMLDIATLLCRAA